jgi:hypothetical protein
MTTKTKEEYYKVIHEGYLQKNTGGFTQFHWPLPTKNRPGKWVRVVGDLVPCRNGLHLTTKKNLHTWFLTRAQACEMNTALYTTETSAEVVHTVDKSVFRSVRLLRKVPTWRVLAELAKHEVSRVREKVTQHEKCSTKLLQTLANDPVRSVRRAANRVLKRRAKEKV